MDRIFTNDLILDNLRYIVNNNKKIGIFVSGGFDSALLLYLCCKFEKDNEFLTFVVDRPNKSLYYNQIVIDWINKKFNKNLNSIVVGDRNHHHSTHVRSAVIEVLNFSLDILLLGDTANPDILPVGPNRRKSLNPKVFQPFYEITKDKLVKMSLDFEVSELLNITGTCGVGKIPACGDCWPCQEKTWALNQNNISL
jgi:7-cyano-7-deazaguanine synthase in queuosine biosynthesis